MACKRQANRVGTYHKFVKTTPKPSATKNSSGELVGPLELVSELFVGVGELVDEVVVVAMVARPGRCCGGWRRVKPRQLNQEFRSGDEDVLCREPVVNACWVAQQSDMPIVSSTPASSGVPRRKRPGRI